MINKFKRLLLGPRKYICVEYDQETQNNIIEYCKEWGIDYRKPTKSGWKPARFHTTIFYTTTRHAKLQNEVITLPKGKAEVTGFDMFGEHKNCMVFKMRAPYMEHIRQTFEHLYEMEDEWPTYNPHTTLCYDYSGEMPNQLPTFPLYYDKLIIKDIEK